MDRILIIDYLVVLNDKYTKTYGLHKWNISTRLKITLLHFMIRTQQSVAISSELLAHYKR